MKTLLRALVLILAVLAIASADDRRKNKSVLVIMTLNAEFLWDGTEPEEGQVNFPWKHSQTEAEEHMRRIAEVIIASDPDILNLVEVENFDALKIFNEQFLANRGYKEYFVQGRDTYTGQDVALLSRIDPEDYLIQRDDRKGRSGNVEKSVSKNYYAKFRLDNMKIALIGLHLLAQPNREDRRLDREAQAGAVRQLAVEQNVFGYHVVVLGDFNDYDGEPSSRDHIDSEPITNVLSALKAMGEGDADDLINAASYVPKSLRYTAHWDKNDNGRVDHPHELTSIDHILLSKTLVEHIDVVEILHNHNPLEATDHFPVVVRLRFSGVSPGSSGLGVRIVGLLPNPKGNDSVNEEAVIKNFSNDDIEVTGWKLRDQSGKVWSLDGLGLVKSGQEKVIRRNNQPMALNNSGDTIELIDKEGNIVQTVTYGSVQEGEVVNVSN